MSVAKSRGGLGFQNLYGFNIALLGKQLWKIMQNPDSFVTRVYKARYFPDSHVLRASKGKNPSFIWSGLVTANDELKAGFRWILGDGNEIIASKDPWLRKKQNFRVEYDPLYEGRHEVVSSFFSHTQRTWNESLVREKFLNQDAEAILAVHIPQHGNKDRVT